MIRTFIFRVRSSPTRSYSPSCSTRSNLLCNSNGISPTSSRKRVPPSAASNRPARSFKAPVKEPFTCPKNSLSYNSRGTEAQLTRISGRPCRRLRSWIARLTSSFPVPDSPVIITVASVGATTSMSFTTCAMVGLWPTMSPNDSDSDSSSRK